MRKSHRGSLSGPIVQKFEGEGVPRYRNVRDKSYGSDTGNPVKELKRASERKPKEEIIKALRLTRAEHLEMQPRKGHKDVRTELPKKRATGGRINRAEADRYTADLNSDTSPYKGYEHKESSKVPSEIKATRLAGRAPRKVSDATDVTTPRYLKGEKSPLLKEMKRVLPSHPDRQEAREERIIAKSPHQKGYLDGLTSRDVPGFNLGDLRKKEEEPYSIDASHAAWKERFGHSSPRSSTNKPSFEELSKTLTPQRRAKGGRARNDDDELAHLALRQSDNPKVLKAAKHVLHKKDVSKHASGGLKPIKIKHPGALHKQMGIPKGQKIPPKSLLAEKHSSNPLTRKRATFALNARKWNHE